MNISKIQEILDNDPKFGPIASVRDIKLATRAGGEVAYSSLAMKIAEAMEKSPSGEKVCNRMGVLAYASILTRGQHTPAGATTPPEKPVEASPAIVVRSTNANEAKLAEKALQKAQQADLSKFVSNGDILKFQGAVAIGQLLAAVYQLAEGDCWDGFERRHTLLNELLESYETVSKKHVNFSVKQIIRAKAEEQFRSGS